MTTVQPSRGFGQVSFAALSVAAAAGGIATAGALSGSLPMLIGGYLVMAVAFGVAPYREPAIRWGVSNAE